MAGHKVYVHEYINRESEKLVKRLNHMPLKGRQTSPAIIKRVKDEVGDLSFDIARTCNVAVSFPKLKIRGGEVVLGEPTIMLPNCKLVGMDELKRIEKGR